jgi:hypothetical protein
MADANGGPPEPAPEPALPDIDDHMFPPGSLIRQLRDLARTVADWQDILSELTTLGIRLPAGRARSTLRAIGFPLARLTAAVNNLTPETVNTLVGAFLCMNIPALAPPPAGFAGGWNTGGCTHPTVFQAVVISRINSLVSIWANDHVDEYTAPPAPAAGGGGGASTAAIDAATAAA